MVSYLSRGANVVLFVVACFLVANTANAIFSAMLAPPDEASGAEQATPPVPQRSTWEQRAVILERNLFDSSATDTAAIPVVQDQDIEATKLPLDLLGTSAADNPRLAWAAVLDREKRETLVVSIGDLLKGKATVERIERRRLVLLEDGARRELTFGDERRPPSSVKRAARTAPSRRRPVANPRSGITRDEVKNALRNPTEILQQARFQPKTEDGQMLGIEVSAIRKGSLLEDVGLENGDLITEFNGIPIEDAQDSGAMLQELAQADEISLVIEAEDGSSRSIALPLRD